MLALQKYMSLLEGAGFERDGYRWRKPALNRSLIDSSGQPFRSPQMMPVGEIEVILYPRDLRKIGKGYPYLAVEVKDPRPGEMIWGHWESRGRGAHFCLETDKDGNPVPGYEWEAHQFKISLAH